MCKCINCNIDEAEQNFTYPTSKGIMSVNLCGVCGANWWNTFKNTNAGQSIIISEVKSKKELKEICEAY